MYVIETKLIFSFEINFLKCYAYRQYGPELPSIHLYPDPQELEDSKTSQPVVALLIFTGRERYVMITMIFSRS